MISAIGGALALYLGMTISMIFEILELFFDFFTHFYAYWRGGIATLEASSLENQRDKKRPRRLQKNESKFNSIAAKARQ